MTGDASAWWRGSVVYQVYIRSFCDSNGDGHGDFRGLISKLDYIASLGVDALWLSPIHPSPNRDWGYDVSDYQGVHPDYGSLEDFSTILSEAHRRGLKILLDEVLCHTSDEHSWFQDSLLRGRKSNWYVWADPRLDGTAPNNWLSAFGGPAWSYQPARRQHYHHKFLRQQPKLNWRNSDAKSAALDVLELWLRRGVDGFRLDVANAYLHDETLTDNPPVPLDRRSEAIWSHAANLQRHLHDANLPENVQALAEIRKTVEKFEEAFVFGEFSEGFERSGAYAAPTVGLHASYTFSMLRATKLSPEFILTEIETMLRHPDYWPCVCLSNHDVTRAVSRFGGGRHGNPALAKLLLAILLTLRGTVLLYQGEELGLPEVDLERHQLRDPVGDLYYPIAKGRDGCRTPMPWNSVSPNLGFTSGAPWLPLGSAHRALAVSEQDPDRESVLNMARSLIGRRKHSAALRRGDIAVIETPSPILAFSRSARDERVVCVFNMSPDNQSARIEGRPLELAPFGFWIG
ncbi:MAG TPA: alpha-amylase family glycosyl hydrolase [Rhizomicrobium sp.]|jgi:alpha-glucosidase|nr:alpha-amylase family glycosyl hydrolase [Rhizomicrobium sp.]